MDPLAFGLPATVPFLDACPGMCLLMTTRATADLTGLEILLWCPESTVAEQGDMQLLGRRPMLDNRKVSIYHNASSPLPGPLGPGALGSPMAPRCSMSLKGVSSQGLCLPVRVGSQLKGRFAALDVVSPPRFVACGRKR